MFHTEELPEDLRLRIVDLHRAGKGYKSISKNLDVHHYTARHVVYKGRQFSTVSTFPRSGRPVKMSARAQYRMFNEIKKNPRVSAIDPLAFPNIRVGKSKTFKT